MPVSPSMPGASSMHPPYPYSSSAPGSQQRNLQQQSKPKSSFLGHSPPGRKPAEYPRVAPFPQSGVEVRQGHVRVMPKSKAVKKMGGLDPSPGAPPVPFAGVNSTVSPPRTDGTTGTPSSDLSFLLDEAARSVLSLQSSVWAGASYARPAVRGAGPTPLANAVSETEKLQHIIEKCRETTKHISTAVTSSPKSRSPPRGVRAGVSPRNINAKGGIAHSAASPRNNQAKQSPTSKKTADLSANAAPVLLSPRSQKQPAAPPAAPPTSSSMPSRPEKMPAKSPPKLFASRSMSSRQMSSNILRPRRPSVVKEDEDWDDRKKKIGEVVWEVVPYTANENGVVAVDVDSEWPLKLPDPEKEEDLRELFSHLDERGFDVIAVADITRAPLTFVAWKIFQRHNFFTKLDLDPKKFVNWVRTVENYYRMNHYHNGTHAADVTQACHLSVLNGLSDMFDDMTMMCFIVSAIIHDVGHDGLNNMYHVRSGSDRALHFNDQSVQENYHLYLGFLILRLPNCNFMDNVAADTVGEMRRIIIGLVLSTDMAKHASVLSIVKDNLEKGPPSEWEDKATILNLALHTADVSNPTRPARLARKWTMWCLQEFWDQGEREAKQSLPISPMCDKATCHIPSSQVGFIAFVVKPTVDLLVKALPKMQEAADLCESNLAMWKKEKEADEELQKQQKEKEEAEKAKAESNGNQQQPDGDEAKSE